MNKNQRCEMVILLKSLDNMLIVAIVQMVLILIILMK